MIVTNVSLQLRNHDQLHRIIVAFVKHPFLCRVYCCEYLCVHCKILIGTKHKSLQKVRNNHSFETLCIFNGELHMFRSH